MSRLTVAAEQPPAEVCGAIVFTDLVGFTEFTAQRGDAEALALIAAQDRIVQGVLPARARVVKELGDGLLLWFDDAAEALRAAFDLHHGLESEARETGLPMWVRVGVHHGHALRRGEDLVGHDVNVAARIVDLAGPGEVLVSEATRIEVRDRLPELCFEELGPVVMKGIPQPIRLFRAVPV
jgi:adenylate cyclase